MSSVVSETKRVGACPRALESVRIAVVVSWAVGRQHTVATLRIPVHSISQRTVNYAQPLHRPIAKRDLLPKRRTVTHLQA